MHFTSDDGVIQSRAPKDKFSGLVGSYGSRQSFMYVATKLCRALKVNASTLNGIWKQTGASVGGTRLE